MTPGMKHDAGKLRMDLLPPEAVRALAQVLTHGAAKYAPNQWRGVSVERYEAALLRHWLAWKEGEALDPEAAFSVRYNLHILWCGSRYGGEYMTYSLLAKYLREAETRLASIVRAHGAAADTGTVTL